SYWRIFGEIPEKAFCRQRLQQVIRSKVEKILARARGCHDSRGNRRSGQVSRKGCNTTSGNVRVKRGSGVQSHLHRQFEASRSYVAKFDAAIFKQLVLHAERLCDDFRIHHVEDQRLRGCPGIRGRRGWHVDLQKAIARKKTGAWLAAVRGAPS